MVSTQPTFVRHATNRMRWCRPLADRSDDVEARATVIICEPILMLCVYFSLIADVQEVFDLFDFWDGRDGLVDAAKIGDLLRCSGLNPTNEHVLKNGGCSKFGL